MAHLDACLSQAGLQIGDIDRIAVTTGPGSFTGVRVGLSTAKGLAIGLKVPVFGVSTLDAAIFAAKRNDMTGSVAAILDARRNQAYFQTDGGEPSIAEWAVLADTYDGFDGAICGSGAHLLNQQLSKQLPVVHANESPEIESVALCSLGNESQSHAVEPIYLRSADAKKQEGAALPRKGVGV